MPLNTRISPLAPVVPEMAPASILTGSVLAAGSVAVAATMAAATAAIGEER